MVGGRSRRLGRDKATLELAGRPLALWVAAALAPVVSELWLVTSQPEVHLALGLPLVTDLYPQQGPLGGLLTALFYARAPWVLVAAADTPFLAPALVAALAGHVGKTAPGAWVCSSARGREPFPGLYATGLLPRLSESLKKERSFQAFLEKSRARVIPPEKVAAWDPQGLSFINLNTPAEVARAVKLAEAHLHPEAPLAPCPGLPPAT
ncbi:MAG: molybdenum cofactor guanylyltransferase [Thermodesulfobacteriota bacterium]